jgi:hypothetical protein
MSGTWATGWATSDVVTAAEFAKGVGAIYDTTLGGSAASIDITGIVGVYAHLRVVVYARADPAAAAVAIGMRFNGDVAANYDYESLVVAAAASTATESLAAITQRVGRCPAATAPANRFSTTVVDIANYAGSTNDKSYSATSASVEGVTTGNLQLEMNGGGWRSTAAINRLTFALFSGNFVTGTRVTVYAMGA